MSKDSEDNSLAASQISAELTLGESLRTSALKKDFEAKVKALGDLPNLPPDLKGKLWAAFPEIFVVKEYLR